MSENYQIFTNEKYRIFISNWGIPNSSADTHVANLIFVLLMLSQVAHENIPQLFAQICLSQNASLFLG